MVGQLFGEVRRRQHAPKSTVVAPECESRPAARLRLPFREISAALVNVIVEFSGATESMTLTVIVPNDGDEAALQEQGIARAKDFALQFAANRA